MTPIRKEFFRRLAYIGLGIIPIIFVWGQNAPESFLGLAGFIFSMYQIIMIVGMSQLIIDDFFPPKTYSKDNPKTFDKLVYYFAMTLFLVGLVFEIFEIRTIDNTFHGTKLFWQSVLVGVILATLVTAFLKWKSPSVYDESDRRLSVHFGLFIGFSLFIPASTSFINHTFANPLTTCKDYTVVRKSTGGARTTSYFIFCNLGESTERFEVRKPLWNMIEEKRTIQLCLRQGYFGYDYVSEFKVTN